jgi:hypothetical protein
VIRNQQRIAALFSCGEPSAVMVKVMLAELSAREPGSFEFAIVRCVVANEHPDNDRFAADCEAWFGHPVTNIASTEYRDCWDVWESRRFLNSRHGAPCTLEMKKRPRQEWEAAWQPEVEAFGYTVEEQRRADTFRRQNPEIRLDTPLIRAGLSASDCAAIVARAGIARPQMYLDGFKHNNCRTCVKARSPGYWANVRQHHPEDFERMAKLSRALNWTPCRAGDDTPIWLDELPASTPARDDSADIDCSLFCLMAEQRISESGSGDETEV